MRWALFHFGLLGWIGWVTGYLTAMLLRANSYTHSRLGDCFASLLAGSLTFQLFLFFANLRQSELLAGGFFRCFRAVCVVGHWSAGSITYDTIPVLFTCCYLSISIRRFVYSTTNGSRWPEMRWTARFLAIS